MRKTFPGYYRPTEDEFSELWNTCLFVLDANVLLNLYRYSPETSEEFIGILNEMSDRLWVPHQVALEYQRRRLDVIEIQVDAHVEIQNLLKKLGDKLPSLRRDTDRSLERINSIFTEVEKELNERKREYLDLLNDDCLRDTITSLFEGKVGSPYSTEQLNEIYKKGEVRYEHEIPPGYLDARDKEGMRKYGDLVLWFQVIDKAQETKKPIILVTDDRKDDWWLQRKGRLIGPRPELAEEILSQAGVSFYMYRADQFMTYAQKYIERQVKQEAIDEVRDVRQRDEAYMKAVQAAALRFPYGTSAEMTLLASLIPHEKEVALAATLFPPDMLAAEAALAATLFPPDMLAAEAALAATLFPDMLAAEVASLAASRIPEETTESTIPTSSDILLDSEPQGEPDEPDEQSGAGDE
jgi:hypothetical protein